MLVAGQDWADMRTVLDVLIKAITETETIIKDSPPDLPPLR